MFCMNLFFLQIESITNTAGTAAGEAANLVAGNFPVLAIGVILIILTLVILNFLKNVVINSVLGVIAWLIITFVFPLFGVQVQLSFFPSLVVSAIFGLAGMGVLLVLAFLGIRI
ncbi:MAG TPA: hypothetical protein VJK05_05415 [archaeon]|nr:hypothetical protein [archaeon]